MKIAVIGSGVSGLAAAAALSQAGHSVRVFEQDHHLGGVTAPFEQDGFRWDLGQLLIEGLGRDEPLGKILDRLGVLDRIQVRKDDRRYVFPDFAIDKPTHYSGPLWRIDRLKALFPAEKRGLDRYYSDYLRFNRLMTCARRSEDSAGLTRLAWQARLYLHLLPFITRKDWSAQRLMDSYFDAQSLKTVFISILADFFTPPSQFIGLGVFSLNPEPSFDSRMRKEAAPGAEQLYHYSILGGIGTLVDALADRIRESGGQIDSGRPVTRIVVDNGRASGVVDADGQTFDADVVVASGGAKETFLGLVGAQHLPADWIARVENQPLMDSIFMLHLGLDRDPTPATGGVCCYYYGTYDLEGAISRARQGIYHQGEEGFVAHVPSAHTPSMAPPGMHAMTLYTICPDRLKEGDWEECKEDYANRLIACAERHIPGLRDSIKVRAVLTPADFRRRCHTNHHAFGGIAPFMGTPRVAHQTPIQGLWFVGAQSESGGGVSSVIPAAYKVAQKIIGMTA